VLCHLKVFSVKVSLTLVKRLEQIFGYNVFFYYILFRQFIQSINFRFAPCIIIVNHFYCPTNTLINTNKFLTCGVCVCVCVRSGRTVHTHHRFKITLPSTRQNIYESLRVILVKHNSVLPDDGSHKIRNMSEFF
jgi:hypothetical protein